MKRLVLAAVLVLAAALALPLAFPQQGPRPWQGWVEAETLFIGAESAGRLLAVDVEEGDAVAEGATLFRLETASEEAAVASAQAALAGAGAALDLARAAQKRPEEVAVLHASEREAQARLALAVQELARARTLFARGTAPRATLDAAVASEAAGRAALDSIRAEIAVAELPGREQAIRQAEDRVAEAQAALDAARVALARRAVAAPAAGSVQQLYYRAGEVVPAGRPVVALLPPENIRIRFFVPQAQLPRIDIGDSVTVTCDGCPPVTAKIRFVSAVAEFTPPVIYSLEERAKLVYRIEAVPETPESLRPGQPVDVTPAGESR